VLHPVPADAAFAAAADHALQHLSVVTRFPRWMLVREVDPEHPRQVVAALDPTGEIHLGQALDGSPIVLAPAEVRLEVVHPDGSRFGALIGDGAVPGTQLDRSQRELAELLAHLLGSLAAASIERTVERRSPGRRRRADDGPIDDSVDVLTGLATRKAWDIRLQEEEAVCAQFGEAAAVIVVELDDLKRINSENGHAAGDDDLRVAGGIVRSRLGDRGTAARLTGDRLALALVGVSRSDARALDASLVSALAERGISAVSAGARRHPERGLFGALSDALAVLDSRSTTEAPPAHTAEQIDEALAGGALTAYFQPIVSLADGRIEALRAVPRWHTESMVLEPDDFGASIRAAHRSGALFRRLVDSGLHLVATFRPTLPDLQVLVALDLDDDPRSVLDALELAATHGLDARALAIGVSEVQAHTMSADLRAALVEVAGAGATLVLTDHDTGSAEGSSAMASLPFTVLGLHRRLTGLLASSGPGSADVHFTIRAALESGATVMAEGVDTQVQRERLHRLGVSFGVGYLYALPQPAEAAATMLQPVLSQRP